MATNHVYVGNDLQLTLETNATISGAEYHVIKYKRPDGAQGYVDASISGTTLVGDIPDTELSVVGAWQFKAYVEISGKKYQGDPVTLEVRSIWQGR